MPTTTMVIAVALCWRILISVSTRTFFQPDEYFQSLEVAHHAVFGYGHLTWEWTASPPIRSIVFPAIYMPVYWLLKITDLDKTYALIIGPKVLQGAIASLTDISVYKLAKRLVGDRYASAALFLSLTSFFNVLSLGRTLSNSVETSLTSVALSFWPWHEVQISKNAVPATLFAALACLVRPTNAIIWIFLFSQLLWNFRHNSHFQLQLLSTIVIVGATALSILVGADSWYFGRLTVTPLNFMLTNASPVSIFYGGNPWHYYIIQALPILCNVSIPFLLLGAKDIWREGTRPEKMSLYLTLWTITVYSLVGHKEWRFIHPILPILHVISAKGLVALSTASAKSEQRVEMDSWSPHVRSLFIRFILLGLIPGVYVSLFHSRAQISVMHYLRSLNNRELKSVGFLMPCHSTPWQAYIHRPEISEDGLMWALGCEPPLHGQNLSTYLDQADVFYSSPSRYLLSQFPAEVDPLFPGSPFPATKPGTVTSVSNGWDHRWPSHLVFFGTLLEKTEGEVVRGILRRRGYSQAWKASNGWEEDWRRRGGIEVWKWNTG